ncbi:hypothetical protein [Micrococcoides hystricis]|uniref:Transmembrane protein n=1 Tax=Micrococcoides hystricis TaxID=1572761 RepID=A0ABV6P8F1_9MICC
MPLPHFYARPSWRLAGQVIADAFVVAWILLCWAGAGIVTTSIKAIATPSAIAETRLGELKKTLQDSAEKIGEVPLVGDSLSTPLADIGTEVATLQAGAHDQVEAIEQAATTIGWLIFLLPVITVILLWLPWRLRFIRSAQQLAKLNASAESRDLLALRALSTAPLKRLRHISDQPLADWRAGNAEVIDALAELELHRHGMSARRRQTEQDRLDR